jgi:hypothetical protein
MFTNCRKKGECLGTYSFTVQDKQMIPYQNGDTFTLIDSLGIDSIKFQADTIMNNYEKWWTEDIYEYSQYLDYIDYYLLEEYSVHTTGSFSVNMNFTDPLQAPIRKSVLFKLDIQSHPEIQDFYGYCYLNEGVFYPEDYPDPVYHYNLLVSHLDTLSICNKQFYSVYCLSPCIAPSDTSECITNLYYSFNKGLVGIKTNSGETWRLK